ncbi:MAG: hypothetical protein M1821_002534 [Bathelium mastoideum]|nr:MAG: hypothetical protein M1821_002534 [Bathelium mastoideum]
MEAIAALGIASNIIQFVDFGLKVVSKGNRIYRSNDGSLAEYNDLELVTNDLLILQKGIEQSLEAPSLNDSDEDDDKEAMKALLLASDKAAIDLLQHLNMAKAQGRFRRWKSLRQALKSIWSKKEIEELSSRLSMLRDELQTRTIISLDATIRQSLSQTQLPSTSKAEVTQRLKRIKESCESITGNVDATPRTTICGDNALLYEPVPTLDQGSADVKISFPYDEVARRSKDVEAAILRSLTYPSMQVRYEAIPEAYAKTFRWILKESEEDDNRWDNFLQWLEQDNPLYWIKGKAASGKSTLMKFLVQQPEINVCLQRWAGDLPIIQANFFFWSLGSATQKSQAGLLLSLLHKILTQRPKMIPCVLPDLWNQLCWTQPSILRDTRGPSINWTLIRLKSIFDDVIQRVSQSGKTIKDIKIYVSEKLYAHRHFAELYQGNQNSADKFIQQIVEMSSGVFLWITLAVKSLLDGLTNYDTIFDLQQRLLELPPELDSMYDKILKGISPSFYQEQASKLLQIVHAAKEPLSSFALSFADEPDLSLAIRTKVSPFLQWEVDARIQPIANRLKSRCRGLLEIHTLSRADEFLDNPEHRDLVQYLHLTLKEFLEKPEVWSELLSKTSKTGFDPNLACLRSCILRLKKTPFFNRQSDIHHLIAGAMSFARHAEDSTSQAQVDLVDELDKTIVALSGPGTYDLRTYIFKLPISGERSSSRPEQSSFMLVYSIVEGLSLYVRAKFGPRLRFLNQEFSVPLLNYATGIDCNNVYHKHAHRNHSYEERYPHGYIHDIDIDIRPLPSMIAMLLRMGLDPNEMRSGSSPWISYMKKIKDELKLRGTIPPNWKDTCELFLIYGADIEALISEGERETCGDVLKSLLLTLPAAAAAKMEQLILEYTVEHKVNKGSEISRAGTGKQLKGQEELEKQNVRKRKRKRKPPKNSGKGKKHQSEKVGT